MKKFLAFFSIVFTLLLFIGCGGSKGGDEETGCSEPGNYGVADLDNFLTTSYSICKTKNDVKGYLDMGNSIFSHPSGATGWAKDFLMDQAGSQVAKYKAKVTALIGDYTALKNDPTGFMTKLVLAYGQKVLVDKVNELTGKVNEATGLTSKSTQMLEAAKNLGMMKVASATSDVNNAIQSCKETISEAPQMFQTAKDLAPKLKNWK